MVNIHNGFSFVFAIYIIFLVASLFVIPAKSQIFLFPM